MRRLIYENKKLVENYSKLALELLKSHEIPQKILELEESLASTDIDLWSVRLIRLDEQIIDLLLHAEKSTESLEQER